MTLFSKKQSLDRLPFRVISSLVLVWPSALATPEVQADDGNWNKAIEVLTSKCLDCHGPDAQESNLRLDSRFGISKGGDFGPVYIQEHAADSELILRITTRNAERRMPPDGEPLTEEETQAIRAWLEAGYPWAQELPEENEEPQVEEPHWAWAPLAPPELPIVREVAGDWEVSRGPIDLFVRSKLSEMDLTPSPPAERRTLIRRLTYDLHGLPPTLNEIEAFENDDAADAYERLVDRLLNSPRYGERWARHWLDVVHYGDTHGYDKDKPRPNAWRYRDFVVKAWNEDIPYREFIEKQIAGDVLDSSSYEGVVATGFLAAGPWDLIGHEEVPETKTDGKIARHLDRDDMVANAIGTFNSVTVHCAQCHHHKFDPISQDDYYSLQAVFAAIDRAERVVSTSPEEMEMISAAEQDLYRAKATLEHLRSVIDNSAAEEFNEWSRLKNESSGSDVESEIAKLEAAIGEKIGQEEWASYLAAVRTESASQGVLDRFKDHPKVYTASTRIRRGVPRPIHLLSRGNVNSPREEMRAGSLSLLSELPNRFDLLADHQEGDRRVALAKWLASEENPLTWRSMANRVWQYHFGTGIVSTASDFGRMGAAPTHPELLDWMAVYLRDSGGSVKSLHREILMSATYRQTSELKPEHVERDSTNQYLARFSRQRLDAESIRDTVFYVAGNMDFSMGGPGWQDFRIERPEHSPHYRYDLADPEDSSTWRRAIYRFIARSQTQPFLTSLDCADPSMRVEKRNSSITPLQSLSMLNNAAILVQCRELAEHIRAQVGPAPETQIQCGYRSILNRDPTPEEFDVAMELLESAGLENVCRVLFNLNEFVFVD